MLETPSADPVNDVLRCGALGTGPLGRVLRRYGLTLQWVEAGIPIPGSYWGDTEAGLIGAALYVRNDTPVHSLLHETCHYVCMDESRRRGLHTNAGGDYMEENGVCFLQILLADHIPALGRARLMQDMDRWGYSFRLGSTAAWFTQDAEDAREWLLEHRLVDATLNPTWRVRGRNAA